MEGSAESTEFTKPAVNYRSRSGTEGEVNDKIDFFFFFK